ncbi:MAG: hypothetical protein FJ304_04885 [Planctomycetes bacterium]|nr:hypothetical protein [Planctomycetota bacterium]
MLYEIDGLQYEVFEAHVTSTELKVEWREDGDIGGFRIPSTDGVTYSGTYAYTSGYPGTVRLRLYRAADRTILVIGDWTEDGTGTYGRWLFELTPMLVRAKV